MSDSPVPPPEAVPPPPPPQGPPPELVGSGPATPPAGAGPGLTSDQFTSAVRSANPLDLAIVACGAVAFIVSFLPYYTGKGEVKGGGPAIAKLLERQGVLLSAHESAWHGFFGWAAALFALAVAAVTVALMLGLLDAALGRLLALGGAGVSLICLVFALFIIPGEKGTPDSINLGGGVSVDVSTGHGIGFWLAAILTLGLVGLAFMRRDAKEQ